MNRLGRPGLSGWLSNFGLFCNFPFGLFMPSSLPLFSRLAARARTRFLGDDSARARTWALLDTVSAALPSQIPAEETERAWAELELFAESRPKSFAPEPAGYPWDFPIGMSSHQRLAREAVMAPSANPFSQERIFLALFEKGFSENRWRALSVFLGQQFLLLTPATQACLSKAVHRAPPDVLAALCGQLRFPASPSMAHSSDPVRPGYRSTLLCAIRSNRSAAQTLALATPALELLLPDNRNPGAAGTWGPQWCETVFALLADESGAPLRGAALAEGQRFFWSALETGVAWQTRRRETPDYGGLAMCALWARRWLATRPAAPVSPQEIDDFYARALVKAIPEPLSENRDSAPNQWSLHEFFSFYASEAMYLSGLRPVGQQPDSANIKRDAIEWMWSWACGAWGAESAHSVLSSSLPFADRPLFAEIGSIEAARQAAELRRVVGLSAALAPSLPAAAFSASSTSNEEAREEIGSHGDGDGLLAPTQALAAPARKARRI